jgi:hypothetical protein
VRSDLFGGGDDDLGGDFSPRSTEIMPAPTKSWCPDDRYPSLLLSAE